MPPDKPARDEPIKAITVVKIPVPTHSVKAAFISALLAVGCSLAAIPPRRWRKEGRRGRERGREKRRCCVEGGEAVLAAWVRRGENVCGMGINRWLKV